MMTVSKFVQYLKSLHPTIKFYNGAIDRSEDKCVGVYDRGNFESPHLALGGKANTSYAQIPVTLLVHWTEDANQCEITACDIYESLFGGSDITLADGTRLVSINLIDPHPVNIDRDENNIAEMVIRAIVTYEREV